MNYLKYLTLVVVFLFLTNTTISAAPTGEDFIRNMISTDLIDNITLVAVNKVVEVAWIILIIVFGITFGFGYITWGIKSLLGRTTEGFMNMEGLFYALFIMVLLGMYPVLIKTLSTGIDYVNKITVLDSNSKQLLVTAQKMTDPDEEVEALIDASNNSPDPMKKAAAIREMDKQGINEATGKKELDDTPWYEKITNYLNPRNWITMIFYGLGKTITFLIRGAILVFTYFYLKALFILGPIAFAFAVFYGWKDIITEWLSAILHTGLVFTTMNLLDYFYAYVFEARLRTGQMTIGDQIEMNTGGGVMVEILINLCFIVLYLSAFKLTKIFLPGKGAGAGMVGKALGLGAAAVGGLAVGAGAMAKGAGGANALKQATSVAQRTSSHFKNVE